jgi:hypothetical protein
LRVTIVLFVMIGLTFAVIAWAIYTDKDGVA